MRMLTGSLTAFLLALLAAPAFAGWSHENDTLYTYYTPGVSMDLITDGSGGLIAGLTVNQQAASVLRMFRIDADGSVYPSWDPFAHPSMQFAPDGVGGVFKSQFLTDQNAKVWLYHVHEAGGADPAWPVDPLVFDFGPGSIAGGIASDDSGGVYVGCSPVPSEGDPLGTLLFRFLPGRTQAPGWPTEGFVVRNTFGELYTPDLPPVVIRDGEGGVVMGFVSIAPSGPLATYSLRAQRVSRDGVRKWVAGGRLLTTEHATGGPILGMMLAGDHVYCLWANGASLSMREIRLQRIKLLDGTAAAGWPATGIPIASGHPDTLRAWLHTDDGSGAFVTWRNGAALTGIRLTSTGAAVAGWGTGVSLVDAAAMVSTSAVASSQGGPIVAWSDHRYPSAVRLRVRWLLPDGTSDPAQPDTGRVIGTSQVTSALGVISDGAGGAYVGWSDVTNLGSYVPYILTWVPYSIAIAVPIPAGAASAHLRAWPNPARRSLEVRFRLADDGPASLALLDVAGHRVRAQDVRGAGAQSARFENLDTLPAGVYFIRLSHGGRSFSTRVALIR
jgi:hypothetical protein